MTTRIVRWQRAWLFAKCRALEKAGAEMVRKAHPCRRMSGSQRALHAEGVSLIHTAKGLRDHLRRFKGAPVFSRLGDLK